MLTLALATSPGHCKVVARGDPTWHAELAAIREACKALGARASACMLLLLAASACLIYVAIRLLVPSRR
jgi:tRNA(Arg) A34 adenosine deaminase TadA